ncbi:17009_t:CDS:2 [Acaulospora morrowiae]|uniref:17009_t:CDS:1 n=1 Tax=Acaulospora morrowiae TaxID=94023 RepID=A0A9N9HJ98_9GLOM|nr:17009_t:CDS:2 [Acaulospora morrowiae]
MSSRSITPLSDVPLSRRVMITNSKGKIISVVSENFLGDGTSSPLSSGTEYIPSSEPPEDAQSEVPSEVSTIEASSYSAHVAPRGRKDILYPSRCNHEGVVIQLADFNSHTISFVRFIFKEMLLARDQTRLFSVPVVLVALLKLIGSEK